MRLRTPEEVGQAIDRLEAEVDLVSFDVFDTLIRRPVVPIERTKVPAARAVVELLAETGRRITVREALRGREDAERRLRRELRASGDDPEFHIDGLCERWLEAFLDPDDAARHAPRIVEAEIDGERKVCRAEEGMVQVVRGARASGRRVVFASDMYLGERHVSELLERCGFGGLFDRGYVSSEHRRSKSSGRLYRRMLEAEGVEPRRWLHIGDHIASDALRPRRLRGRSIHYWPDGAARGAIRRHRLQQLTRVHPHWTAASLLEMCREGESAHHARELRYAVGFWVLGPLFANFIHRAIGRLVEEKIELVLFPAREGFLFGQLFDRLRPHVAPEQAFRSAYTCLTHKATSLPFHVALREVMRNGHSRSPTLRDLVVRMHLDPERFEGFARQCGLSSLDAGIARLTDQRMVRFIQHPEMARPLREARAEHCALLSAYLGQLGFWNVDRVGLVDIGWRGTLQEELTRLFENRSDFPRLHGLYLALYRFGRRPDSPWSSYEGLLYQYDRDPVGSGPFLCCTEILELATRAPHPTALGLERNETTGSVVPVFQEQAEQWRSERADRELLTSLQAGILDFADAYVATLPYHEDPPAAHSAFFVSQLDRLLRMPRKDEARAFRGFYHRTEMPIDAPHPRWPLWPEGSLSGHGQRAVLALYNLARSLEFNHW